MKVIGRMFADHKFDMLALGETKLKGKSECEFGCVSGRMSGVTRLTRGKTREGVALMVSLAESVCDGMEVSSRLMWVKVKLVERCRFLCLHVVLVIRGMKQK